VIDTDEIKPTQTFKFKIEPVVLIAFFMIFAIILLIIWAVLRLNIALLLFPFTSLIFVLIFNVYIVHKASLIFFNNMIIITYSKSRIEIMYPEVTEITIPGNIWTSYGFSLDTIRIKYGKKKVSFAPKEKDEVLELLKERCPQAKMTIKKK